MTVQYDPAARRGQQFSIEYADGRSVVSVAQGTVLALLRSTGKTINEAATIVAEAKLSASNSAA
jgi:hypothetical protein